MGNSSAWPVGLCWVVFLCSHVFTALSVGWWVWVRVGLGIDVVMDEHTVGFTFNTV